MKRYLVFIAEKHYPNGGMYDFHSEHDTLKKCLKEIDKEFGKFTEQHNNYWNVHIYDTEASIVIGYPECLQSKNQNQ